MQKLVQFAIKWFGLPLLKKLGELLIGWAKKEYAKWQRKKEAKKRAAENLKKAEDYENSDPSNSTDSYNELP